VSVLDARFFAQFPISQKRGRKADADTLRFTATFELWKPAPFSGAGIKCGPRQVGARNCTQILSQSRL
ncbi:MAG: hypothetical protein Q4F18_12595, partial [Clostridia bacterium]|nr:hypothetical protein [Clostridia bacterium]